MRSNLVLAAITSAALLAGPMSLATSAQSEDRTLSIAFSSDLASLDPAIANDFISTSVERMLYDTLVTYDDGTGIVPGLATELPTISGDGLTYTFHLRPDVPFVRKGEIVRMMTADDVVFSINRLLRPDLVPTPSPAGPSFFSIIEGADAVLAGSAQAASGIRAIAPDTVEITLTHPDRTFLNLMAMTFGSVVPADLAGLDAGAFAADPVGTGPYYLESYSPGEQAVFRANPHYWRAGFPRNDAVEVRLLVDAQAQVLQVEAGQLDLMGDVIAPADFAAIEADPGLADQVVRTDLAATTWLAMDTSGPDSPFADKLVRQAVNLVIDKDNLVRIVNGRARPVDCIFPTLLPGFDPDCHPYQHSLERAKALMAQAGNTGFSTKLYSDDSPVSTLMTQSIASDLGQLGIKVEVILNDWDTFVGIISKPHAAPLALSGWSQDFPDPADFIDPMFTCGTAVEGGANLSWYCDPAVDAAAAKARRITDLDVAIPEYQRIQRTIMEAAPVAPLILGVQDGLKSDRVTNFDHHHPVWLWDFASIGLK